MKIMPFWVKTVNLMELSNKYGSVCSKVAFNILNNKQNTEECVNEATVYTGEKTTKHKRTWIKWTAVVACLVICVAIFLSIGRQYVKLDNGDILIFNASTELNVADMIQRLTALGKIDLNTISI